MMGPDPAQAAPAVDSEFQDDRDESTQDPGSEDERPEIDGPETEVDSEHSMDDEDLGDGTLRRFYDNGYSIAGQQHFNVN